MRVIIFGAGIIGSTIARLLAESGDYAVTLADRDAAALARIRLPGVATRLADLAELPVAIEAAHGHDIVVSALPYFLNPPIARAAHVVGAHYFDLTEDVAVTRAVRALAEGASTAFVPQCGLAPGFVGIVAHDLAQRFEKVRSVKMRVGALPRYPSNALKYNLTWSTDGLINEYCNPCEAIRSGEKVMLEPLEGLEHFALDGVEYEAFNTSGGLGTLTETLAGKVDSIDYKTIRYPGHRDIMKLLLQDLRLAERRSLMKDVLETALPTTAQDVVIVFVAASGWRQGKLVEESYAQKIYGDDDASGLSAIQKTTAAGLCAMVELMRQKKLPLQGFVGQEQARLTDFLATRYGRLYAQGTLPAPVAPRVKEAA
jgi:saccharopine dehydrogenase-like NADP-dependent oxidoreductase